MSGTIDKIRKLRASRPSGNSGGKLKGIFHQWNDGDNILRLVGQFLETKTHFLAPAPKRGERGLCRADAFQGNEKMAQVVNCLNWDIVNEEERKGGCPICRLGNIAHQVLKEECTEEEKKIFEKLRSACNARTQLKWNILDRDDPFVLSVENGSERKVPGYKIASIGMEAWDDIEGVFDQMGFDISDPEEGLDICVNKGHNGTRVAYSAQAVIDKTKRPPVAKVTPLTPEEQALTLHDLKVICGKSVDAQKIIDSLHEDYRELLDVNPSDEVEPEETPKEAKTSVSKPVVDVDDEAGDEESSAAAAALDEDEDEDGLMTDTVPVKKISRNPVKN